MVTPFSPEKHQEGYQVNKVLGVGVDLTEFLITFTIRFKSTVELCAELIEFMERAESEDYLPLRHTESLLVMLNFTLSDCPRGVGRVVTQSLIIRVGVGSKITS